MKKLAFLLIATALACGSARKETTPKKEPVVQKEEETGQQTQQAQDSLVIEGDLGEIDQDSVQKKFDEGIGALRACIDKAGSLTYVGGDMEFVFRIALDGTVKWLKMRSTIGNWDVERCVYEWAKSLQFVRPKGGEAQVSYSWGYDPIRPAKLRWGEDKVGHVLKRLRRRLRRCSDGTPEAPSSYRLVFYVIPGGEVSSLGISTGDVMVSEEFYRCVEKVLKKAKFPDPMGRVAKVMVDFEI